MWTEAEAKTRWCPLARQLVEITGQVGVVGIGSANRFSGEQVALCIGSSCMAWRWKLTKEPLTDGQRKAAGRAFGLAYAFQPTTYERGYCGAFGAASGRPPKGDDEVAA